jgi:cytochrome P450
MQRDAEWNPAEFTEPGRRMEQMAEVRERCPVAWTALRGGMWTITRYKDLMAVASDPATFSNGGAPRFGRRLPPLEVDPPEHGSFRKILQRFWLPSRIRAMEPAFTQAVTDALDRIVARGSADLALEIARPMPVFALCKLLDMEPDLWGEIKELAEIQLEAESTDEAVRTAARAAHERLLDHARAMVADRRAALRDPEADIASALLIASETDPLINDELIAGVLRILISAGHNSTTNAMGNTLLYLATYPEAQSALRADPSKIPTAIEELLRYESPVQELPRYCMREVELEGRHLAAGDRIAMLWGSGNRDADVFERPDDCLLDRKPNRHLAFGYGIHTCLGAPMARMELRVVVEQILARTRAFALDGEVVRKPYHHMGVARLPVRIEA